MIKTHRSYSLMSVLLTSSLLMSSCMQFLKLTDDSYFESIDNKTKSSHLNILFSHNINGETHPCGCRNFPLGGLPQAAGKMYEIKNKAPLIYVDTGDTLFPSTTVPSSLIKSQTYTANKIIEALELQGLKFFVPGDQDFALGEKFLADVSKKAHFDFLISNLDAAKSKIEAKPWKIIKYSNQNLVFIGVVNTALYGKHQVLFKDPYTSIKEAIADVKRTEKDLKNPKYILLSHGGVEFDKKLAKAFKEFSWIVGAHSQSFLRDPITQDKAKLVQVLSRNHYLGHIQVAANPKNKDNYFLIENRDELKDLWPKNPFISWLTVYKSELDKILLEEQSELAKNFDQTKSAPTANSCVDCHSKQVDFWKGTAHSLAYITLHTNKAANNPECIKCHSLNHMKESGFINKKNMIITDKNHDQYWKEFNQSFDKTPSIRKMPQKNRIKYYNKWQKLDQKYEVTHNYANVQCLNCHTKNFDHPFGITPDKIDKDYQSKCISCHTSDQSPDWYNKNDKGIATTLNLKYFKQQLKTVACPKNE